MINSGRESTSSDNDKDMEADSGNVTLTDNKSKVHSESYEIRFML
jgi:hypothetical protein